MKNIPIFNDLLDLERYIDSHEDMSYDMFALIFGPYLVQNPDFATYCDENLRKRTPYIIPYIYARYIMETSKNTSPQDCKKLVKSFYMDMNEAKKLYPNHMEYINLIEAATGELIKKYIQNIRQKQSEEGILESSLTNFSPIVPYGTVMSKDYCFALNSMTDLSVFNTDTNVKDQLGVLQCHNPIGIITHWMHYSSLSNQFDIYQNLESYPEDSEYFQIAKFYFIAFSWLDKHNKNTSDTIGECLEAFNIIKNGISNQDDLLAFENIITQMNYDDSIVEESWSAIDDKSKEITNKLLSNVKKEEHDSFDLDLLTSTIFNMRHIELSEYANRFLLGELKDVEITDYNYIYDNLLACEINGKYLAVPYVDIADDYTIKVITIDRSGNIKIFDDIHSFGENVENVIYDTE